MKNILVVDDDLNMRIYIATVMNTSGYKAIVARDGKDGFRAAQDASPILIILDLMMPEEGGIIMYRNLKEDPKLKNVPVIVVSGVESKTFDHSLKMLNIGRDSDIPEPEAYIEKPPKAQELIATVEAVLQLASE